MLLCTINDWKMHFVDNYSQRSVQDVFFSPYKMLLYFSKNSVISIVFKLDVQTLQIFRGKKPYKNLRYFAGMSHKHFHCFFHVFQLEQELCFEMLSVQDELWSPITPKVFNLFQICKMLNAQLGKLFFKCLINGFLPKILGLQLRKTPVNIRTRPHGIADIYIYIYIYIYNT